MLSAIAVKKLVGIQSDFWGERVNLTIPIDVRQRVKGFGQRFFGNGIMLHKIKFGKEYLENSHTKDIAIKIRKSMPYVSSKTYKSYLTELKTKLYSIVGDAGGIRRIIEPICGTVNQDEWGTAQGVWFLTGTSIKERSREDEHAALVHHNVDPTRGVFSIGTSMEKSGLSTGAFNFIPRNSGLVNRDFDQVKPDGNIYCYENGSGVEFGNQMIVIIIKLLDGQTLRMERLSSSSCGSSSWKFSSNYTDFER